MTFWNKCPHWISFGDLLDLLELGSEGWKRLRSRLTLSPEKRVTAAWQHVSAPPKNWWDIPAVRHRWNRMITGDEQQSPVEWVVSRWLSGTEYRAFSPGCGTGHRELRWAATGKFRHILAMDLSPTRIRLARQRAREAGLSHVVQFEVGNVFSHQMPDASLDVIIVEDALHHFAPVEEAVRRFHRWLKPGGLIIVNEFVGPRRFQWPEQQVKLATAALQLLPEEHRRLYRSGRVKQRVYRPGLLRMWLQDPSEAVESDQILPALQRYFQIETLRGYGGTLLALIFNGIAQHFVEETPQTHRYLELLFGIEDYFLQQDLLPHDYVFVVGRKKEH